MVINTNISAQTSARFLGQSSALLAKSLARLSSGSKITSPEDDAAGLAVSMKFDAEVTRSEASISNLSNALSFGQTQDGFLQKVGKALDRMSELAVLAQDATKTDSDRSLYNKEYQSLSTYVSDVAKKDFNGVSLFSTNGLKVTDDGDGGTFALTAIKGDYLAVPDIPGSPGPAPSSLSLGDLIPGFTGGTIRYTQFANSTSYTSSISFTASSTITDLVNGINGLNAGKPNGAQMHVSYDSSTGAFSVTVQSDANTINTLSDISSGSGIFVSLGLASGFSTALGFGSPRTGSATLTYTPPPTPGVGPNISTVTGAAAALTTVKSAITQLATDRATVGANIARMTANIDQLSTLKENLTASVSRIKDVDVAQESTSFARYNILVQAGTAMLSQANASTNSVLQLLR